MTAVFVRLELDEARDLIAAARAGVTHAYVDPQRAEAAIGKVQRELDYVDRERKAA